MSIYRFEILIELADDAKAIELTQQYHDLGQTAIIDDGGNSVTVSGWLPVLPPEPEPMPVTVGNGKPKRRFGRGQNNG